MQLIPGTAKCICQVQTLFCLSSRSQSVCAAEARKKDIPIVQLNPGGTLNYKYAGETAVRSAGLPYSVIRSTGTILSSLPALRCQRHLQLL